MCIHNSTDACYNHKRICQETQQLLLPFNADFQNPEKLCVKGEKQGRSTHKKIEADVRGQWCMKC